MSILGLLEFKESLGLEFPSIRVIQTHTIPMIQFIEIVEFRLVIKNLDQR